MVCHDLEDLAVLNTMYLQSIVQYSNIATSKQDSSTIPMIEKGCIVSRIEILDNSLFGIVHSFNYLIKLTLE